MILTYKEFKRGEKTYHMFGSWLLYDNQIIISIATIKNSEIINNKLYHINSINNKAICLARNVFKFARVYENMCMNSTCVYGLTSLSYYTISPRFTFYQYEKKITRAPNPVPCSCKIRQIKNVIQLTPLNLHEFYKIPSAKKLVLYTIMHARILDISLIPEIVSIIIKLTAYLWYNDLKTYAWHYDIKL